MSRNDGEYIDYDFKPATTPGWRAVYLDDSDGYFIRDVVGWIVQLWTRTDDWGTRIDPAEDRGRRFLAAVMDDALIRDAWDDDRFWVVLGPSDVLPTQEEVSEERERRAAIRARNNES